MVQRRLPRGAGGWYGFSTVLAASFLYWLWLVGRRQEYMVQLQVVRAARYKAFGVLHRKAWCEASVQSPRVRSGPAKLVP